MLEQVLLKVEMGSKSGFQRNAPVFSFKNEFIVQNRFADFENSYAKRVMDVFAEPALVEKNQIGQK
ncbi:hypothetical protein [Pseudomonas sp. ATCC PTA-122608]|uniref:hypothetical protein n=1 Tax=Pseudomonas sp. ATCC PTA-122608 TaxID=1771311 RepID=UPI00117A1B9D|nr:hypothetical protein [Pseudomonas sp. ATCC PTA-122608]